MTKSEIAQQALSLPFEDQLDLVQTLWENASSPLDFELSPELKELLEARLKEAQENPDDGLTWEEVKARVFERR